MNSEYFVADLIDNVCVLLRDGDNIGFLHRSFQEYFSASFLANNTLDKFAEVVDAVAPRHSFDSSVIPLLFEMNRSAFEKQYLEKRLEKAIRALERARGTGKGLALFFTGAEIEDGGKVSVMTIVDNEMPKYFHINYLASTLYGDDVPEYTSLQMTSENIDKLRSLGARKRGGRRVIEFAHMTSEEFDLTLCATFENELHNRLSYVLRDIRERDKNRRGLLSEALLGVPSGDN